MNLWIVSRECEGIIGAGGVKNVTYSLCKDFQKLKNNVTLFIPVYKTTAFENISNYIKDYKENIIINHCGKTESVSYGKGICKNGGFNIVLIQHASFLEKEDIYTYTEKEQKLNSEHKKGTGHVDSLFMDTLFCKAVTAYLNLFSDKELPDIIHCQDASTASLPAFIKEQSKYNKTKTVVTIHNAGPAYHHSFKDLDEALYYTDLSRELLEKSKNKERVEPFLMAASAGAKLTTVSENYALELTDPENDFLTEGLSSVFKSKKIKIKGITNGIDYETYDPSDTSKSLLPYKFNPKALDLEGKFQCRNYFIESINKNKTPKCVKKFGKLDCQDINKSIFINYHGRITQQKGVTVLLDAIPAVINNFPNVYFIIFGQGQLEIEEEIKKAVQLHKGRILFLNGYDKAFSRLANAASDFIVLPSFFEPCGLEDYIAQCFGTIPVANATGGLNKILNYETGFLYTDNTPQSLIAKLSEVITLKLNNTKAVNNIIKNSVSNILKNYDWNKVIKNKYLPFFQEILQKK